MDYGIIGGADGPTAVLVAAEIGFEWNWINWFGVITVILILLPNIVYAVKCRGEKNLCTKRLLNVLEQIGRYGSMLFLIVYVGTEDGFAFGSVFELLCYCFGNLCLILAYWIVWGTYFKEVGVFGKKMDGASTEVAGKNRGQATAVFIVGSENVKKIVNLKYTLAILPTALFLLDGITLWRIPLMLCALVFAIGHIGVTHENIKNSYCEGERRNTDDI